MCIFIILKLNTNIPVFIYSLNWAAQLLQQQRPQPRRKFWVSALYSLPQLSQFLFIIPIY